MKQSRLPSRPWIASRRRNDMEGLADPESLSLRRSRRSNHQSYAFGNNPSRLPTILSSVRFGRMRIIRSWNGSGEIS
jgi:hypothetical protein